MSRRDAYSFCKAAAISGGLFTVLLLLMGISIIPIATWTLINLVALGYIERTGGPYERR